ncbi:MAG: hypothetical protein IPP96_17065 [Chitinophagaceae bacterium]|nr:hypothetical protein [Chitinophagaceae bacterium]
MHKQTDTTATSNSNYQQIVTYLEHQLNTLVLVNEDYANHSYLSTTTSFTGFKISKDASGNFFLNLKQRKSYIINNKEKTLVYSVDNMSTPICNITDIKKVDSDGKTYISILGETEITCEEHSGYSLNVGRKSLSNGLYFNLYMEASNTIEMIKNAFLYLSTYCPTKKKDIN